MAASAFETICGTKVSLTVSGVADDRHLGVVEDGVTLGQEEELATCRGRR